MVSRTTRAIGAYLKDWKNWLVHAVVGFGLLYIALFMPVAWYYRAVIFASVIVFNTLRMHYAK